MIKIWHHTFGSASGEFLSPLLEHLRLAGVISTPLDICHPRGPGIILLSEPGLLVYSLIHEASHCGCERVLVIDFSDNQLTHACWQVLDAGASDILCRGDPQQLANEIASRFQRWLMVDELRDSALVRDNLIGRSRIWQEMLRQIIEMARFTETPALITGESGTGKELVARLIHTLDSRTKKQALVVLDCTTIVPSLSGSEFFGHERGAFTGAVSTRDGAFALADGGTLFLDEIGELSLELQAQLLRVIQERTYKRVGGNTWFKTEFRLICATNRSLPAMAREGRFRHDLYHRIASWTFQLPPLRERREDILPLSRHFIEQCWADNDTPDLSQAVQDFLLTRDYPGNVRELKQLVCRITQRHVGTGPITVGAIPRDERPAVADEQRLWHDHHFERSIHTALQQGVGLKEIGRVAEDAAVRIAVWSEQGNLQRAALKLGVTDRALQLRRANRREPSCEPSEPSPLVQ